MSVAEFPPTRGENSERWFAAESPFKEGLHCASISGGCFISNKTVLLIKILVGFESHIVEEVSKKVIPPLLMICNVTKAVVRDVACFHNRGSFLLTVNG